MNTFCATFLSLAFPSIATLVDRGMSREFLTCLLLSLVPLASILYSFSLRGISNKNNLMSLLLPAYSIYSLHGFGAKFAASVVLSCLLWIPGMFYAYYEWMKVAEAERAKPEAEYSSIIN